MLDYVNAGNRFTAACAAVEPTTADYVNTSVEFVSLVAMFTGVGALARGAQAARAGGMAAFKETAKQFGKNAFKSAGKSALVSAGASASFTGLQILSDKSYNEMLLQYGKDPKKGFWMLCDALAKTSEKIGAMRIEGGQELQKEIAGKLARVEREIDGLKAYGKKFNAAETAKFFSETFVFCFVLDMGMRGGAKTREGIPKSSGAEKPAGANRLKSAEEGAAAKPRSAESPKKQDVPEVKKAKAEDEMSMSPEELKEFELEMAKYDRDEGLRYADTPDFPEPKISSPAKYRKGTVGNAMLESEEKMLEFRREIRAVDNNLEKRARTIINIQGAEELEAHARNFSPLMGIADLNIACKYAQSTGVARKRFLEIFDDIGEEIATRYSLVPKHARQEALEKSLSLAVLEAKHPEAYNTLKQALTRCGHYTSEANISTMQENLTFAARENIPTGKFLDEIAKQAEILKGIPRGGRNALRTDNEWLEAASAAARLELMPQGMKKYVGILLEGCNLEANAENMGNMHRIVRTCNQTGIDVQAAMQDFKGGFGKNWISLESYIFDGRFFEFLLENMANGTAGLPSN